MPLLDIFRDALALSEEMAKLAKGQEWEALSVLEKQRAELLSALPGDIPPSTKNAAAIAELINKIQACDSETRDFVEPWMEHAKALLSRLSPSTTRE